MFKFLLSLVVGDVKQSIYRWRGSDWRLLGSRLEQQFPRAATDRLDSNYRTLKEIVEFNNAFFSFAAKELDTLMGTDSMCALYADVEQKVRIRDSAPGSVEVIFTKDQKEQILQSLRDLSERGISWDMTAILVRGNAEGSAIASSLVEAGIPVVSDDSLFVKSSITVRRLVSQLSLIETPEKEDRKGVAGFLAGEMNISKRDSYHSLTDLSEDILREIKAADEETFQAEVFHE